MLKYQRWHDQIIERARVRKLDPYIERHHVVPRAFGGSDDPGNLVDLTYREHFLIHWLLTKLSEGYQRRMMVYALHMMAMDHLSGRKIAGWQIEIAKRILKNEALKRAAARREVLRQRRKRLAESALNAFNEAGSLNPRDRADRDRLSALAHDLLVGHPNKLRQLGTKRRKRYRKRANGTRAAPPTPPTTEALLTSIAEENS